MSEAHSIDDILKSIRGRVRARDNGAFEPYVSQKLRPHSISLIRSEVEAAQVAHRQFGELNPRLPGFHNRAAQLVKKAIRRSLTWYTRPLQLFQGATLRALQQLTSVLQNHGSVLREVDDKLENAISAQNERIARLTEDWENLGAELQKSAKESRGTAGSIDGTSLARLPMLGENDKIIAYWNRAAKTDPMRETVSQGAGESDEEYFQNWVNAGEYIARKIMSCSPPNPIALEVGPGMGRVTLPMSRLCKSILALDISPEMVRRTRETLAGLANFEAQVITDEDLSFLPREHFDLAYSIACFQHADKKSFYRYLRGIRRALKPGGVLFFGVMNLCSEAGWGHVASIVENDYPEFFHTPDEIACYLAHSGYSFHDLSYEGETLWAMAHP